MMAEEIMDKETSRKIKNENLTRCMNCEGFETCNEVFKEKLVDCCRFVEVSVQNQVVVVKLSEWGK